MEIDQVNDTELTQKVKVALAIAAIKTKPPEISLGEYVSKLQRTINHREDSAGKGSLDLRKRIHVLQHELLWGVLPLESQQVPCKALVDSKHNAPDIGFSEDIFEDTEFHIHFIQAMIQLKSIANNCSSIKSSTFRDIISSMPRDDMQNRCYIHVNHKSVSQPRVQASCGNDQVDLFNSRSSLELIDDSGYDSNTFSSVSKRESDVSSDMVKYLIYNSDANKVLVESVNVVLTHLQTIISNKDICSLEYHLRNWRGSLLEDAVTVLNNTINLFHNEEAISGARSSCLKFIKKVITDILEKNPNTKYTDLEYQCMAVSELCNNVFLCSDTIDFLLERVVILSQDPKKSCVLEFNEISNKLTLDSDRYYYIFYLLEILLKKYVKLSKNCAKEDKAQAKETKSEDVMELWKSNFSLKLNTPTNVTNTELKKDTKVSNWMRILEECTVKFSCNSPKLAFSSWSCFNIIKSCV